MKLVKLLLSCIFAGSLGSCAADITKAKVASATVAAAFGGWFAYKVFTTPSYPYGGYMSEKEKRLRLCATAITASAASALNYYIASKYGMRGVAKSWAVGLGSLLSLGVYLKNSK